MTGVLHFLTPQTQSSLYRNDRVRMTRDERGNFVDSEGVATVAHEADGPCTFSFHSAFHDPHTPEDAPDRWSIEVRCMALY